MAEILLERDLSLIIYEANFVDYDTSLKYFEHFSNQQNIPWEHDKLIRFGVTKITKRKIALYGDDSISYNYSGNARQALPFGDKYLLQIKKKLEEKTGHKFNSCLMNLYHDGSEGMGYHGDNADKSLVENSLVAIISFGMARYFKVKENATNKTVVKKLLENGSLLIMAGNTQEFYQHEIPKMMKVKGPRVSLTFRLLKG
jgi:alkylated DNA repair dioxygenase AlkB